MKKVLILVVLFWVSIFALNLNVYAYEDNEKIYCNVTINDNFVDNELLVVFNSEESKLMKTYDINYFSAINCINVEDLTSNYNEIINDIDNKTNENENFNRIFKLTLGINDKSYVLEAMHKLEQIDEIKLVQPNILSQIDVLADDIQELEQMDIDWGFDKIDIDLIKGSGTSFINTDGCSEVIVGIVDSGVNAYHPELIGQIDSVLSKSFVDENPLIDEYNHGTGVAGVMASLGNLEDGVEGICNQCTFVSLQVYNTSEQFQTLSYSNLIEMINYAEMINVDILNMSIEIDGFIGDALNSAIDNFTGLVVCAAGNYDLNIDDSSNYFFPASYPCENIISVGASHLDDTKWNYQVGSIDRFASNFGETSVDLFAPGSNVFVLDNSNNYYSCQMGTSIAAPFVSGVAALLMSEYVNLSYMAVKDIILSTVNDSTHLVDYCQSGGVLNGYNALKSYDDLNFEQSINIIENINNGFGKFGIYNVTPGFVSISLNYSNFSNSHTCEEGTISVKRENQIIKKFNIEGASELAINNTDQSYLIVHLSEIGQYYIDVNIDDVDLINLNIFVQQLDNYYTIDTFDYSLYEEISEDIFSDENNSASVAKINIPQATSFSIDITFTNSQSQSINFFIYKVVSIGENTLVLFYNDNFNSNKKSILSFETGIYYIGYENLISGCINISLTRNYSGESGEIVSDPNAETMCGSHINLYQSNSSSKSYRGNEIVAGFTRLLYLSGDSRSVSRLDYYWYSSNPEAAIVSEYGTVLAISDDFDSFTIMAVYKGDASIVYIKNFIILDENNMQETEIDLGIKRIKKLTYYDISFGENIVPSQYLQHYEWECSNYNISVSPWGKIYANDSVPYGAYTIIGRYKYNSNIIVKITISVIR